MRTIRCEMCGSTFECGGFPSCWCLSVRVERDHLADVARLASDCVCSDCLRGSHQAEEGDREPDLPVSRIIPP